jgi:hypothetical protein
MPVADIIELRAHLNQVEDELLMKILTSVVARILASISEDDAIRTEPLMAEMEKAASRIGRDKAKMLLHLAWTSALEVIEDHMKAATRELNSLGVFDHPSVR